MCWYCLIFRIVVVHSLSFPMLLLQIARLIVLSCHPLTKVGFNKSLGGSFTGQSSSRLSGGTTITTWLGFTVCVPHAVDVSSISKGITNRAIPHSFLSFINLIS